MLTAHLIRGEETAVSLNLIDHIPFAQQPPEGAKATTTIESKINFLGGAGDSDTARAQGLNVSIQHLCQCLSSRLY
jgi:hypothetical protein